MGNKLDLVPKFTTDDSVETGTEEVVESTTEAPAEEVVEEEKESPAEPPAVEKPVEVAEKPLDVNTGELATQVQGLQEERVKLLKDIQELRGQRREIKKDELLKVDSRIDELKDLHPDDVALIDRILRAKGYLTKEESNRMFYEAVKQEELTKFLDKFPEYKPENDPSDVNWTALQRELALYRMPDNPHDLGRVLERAHKTTNSLQKAPSDRSITAKQKQVQLAGVGSNNTQRSSSKQSASLSPFQKGELSRGGWSEEDIIKIEQSLS